MIDINEKVKEQIELRFATWSQLEFERVRTLKLFEDAGDRASLAFNAFENRTASEITNTIYGTIYPTQTALVPIAGTTIYTYSATVEIICEAKAQPATAEGDITELQKVLNTSNRVADALNAESISVDDYNVTFTVSPAVVGEWSIDTSFFGELLPVRMNVNIVAVYKGINSNNFKITVDGYDTHALKFVISRSKTLTARSYSENGTAKNTAEQQGFGIDFNCPILDDSFGFLVISQTLNGGSLNQAHSVSITIGDNTPKEYVCIFGNVTLNGEAGANLSAQVSLVERDKNA